MEMGLAGVILSVSEESAMLRPARRFVSRSFAEFTLSGANVLRMTTENAV